MEKNLHTMNTMRVYVTERCNADCPSCVNAKSRSNREMPVEKFERLSAYLSENGITTLKMLGGEPSIHSSFFELVEIAKRYFPKLVIFTNGMIDFLETIELREKDGIVYNFSFNKMLSKDKFHLDKGGVRSLEIQVHSDTDEIQLAERILELADGNSRKVRATLTLDCTTNIFTERGVLVPKLRYLEEKLIDRKIYFSYDHKMPLCYLYKSGLHPGNNGQCGISTAGVIDADLNLRYCLQYSDVLLSIMEGDAFIPWQILMNNVYKYYYQLRLKSLDKICLACVFFNKKCNGGCWIPKEQISRGDILGNTDFPIKAK